MNIEYKKYKVGDKFDFGGNIEIVMCSVYNKDPQYWVRMTDGRMKLVDEGWLDARVNHFSSDKKKRDVYIPATPEEFKVGDRVEILASDNSSPSYTGKEGIIVADWGTEDYIVKFPDLVTLLYNAKHLRKLPEISSDKPKEYKPIPLIDAESEWISRFKKIVNEIIETFKAKNADYGNAYADGFSRFGAVQLVSRIYEKYCRIENLLVRKADNKVIDESACDTLTDIATQCIILRMLLESQTVNFENVK